MSFQIIAVPISIPAKNCLTVSKDRVRQGSALEPAGSCLPGSGDGKSRDTEDFCSPDHLRLVRASPPGRGKNDESHVPIRGTRSRFVQRGFGVLRFLIAGFRFMIDRCKSQIRNLKSAIRYPRVEAESAQPAG
jgi:hypothetical protein